MFERPKPENNLGQHVEPGPSSETVVGGVFRANHLGTSSTTATLSANNNQTSKYGAHKDNFSVDSNVYQQAIDRRKGFRTRGSLGPTIASAPSVEQEDYRTPRVSVTSVKNGKSFDLSDRQGQGARASDSNGLIKVSADFLRLHGSRQQFRNLLSARKKLGQMPPAYTRIDYSHDSFDSAAGKNTINSIPHNGPVITVEDTAAPPGCGLSSVVSSCPGSARSSIDDRVAENGLLTSPASPFHNNVLSRNNSRYGVPIDGAAVKMIYKIRSQRLNTRVKIADRCLILALIGILFMGMDTEICAQNMLGVTKNDAISLCFRTFVVFSTLALLVEIVHYHANEIMLDLIDCGADDWRVVCTWRRVARFFLEFLICSFCPLPGTGTILWSFVEPSKACDHFYVYKPVPLDLLLSLFMLCRVYLAGRFAVLHSKQFQDASTRTLAALNRIQVNFTFVMKSWLDQHPMRCLSLFLLMFWFTFAWTFVQCERFGREGESKWLLYSNALWFIASTFNGNGYGDVVPKTTAGRLVGIFVGLTGAIISSILIAVISRKIVLSPGQRNVNNFMNDSRLTQEHKDAAARVLQKTWHIYKSLHSNETKDDKLRYHQRQFLNAIHKFRRIKNKIRVFNESNDATAQQATRFMLEMHTNMLKLMSTQEEMRTQIEVMQRAMRNHFTHANAVTIAENSKS